MSLIDSSFDSPDFRLNPPAKNIQISKDRVTIQALPRTDYWRIPASEGEEAADRRNGAFFSLPVDPAKSFEAGVWIQGKWGVQYDQGCLMIIVGEGDGKDRSWVKTGVELDEGKQWIGGVVASPWSDWSIQPATENTSQLSEDPFWLFMLIRRIGPTLRIYHYFARRPGPVGEKLKMIREVKGFDEGSATCAESWRVGVMVCGPKNDEGTEATFQDFYVKYL